MLNSSHCLKVSKLEAETAHSGNWFHILRKKEYRCTGLDKQNIQRKVVNIFLPISFNICFGSGAQKNCLIKTVLLSTHNICFH